MQLPTKPTNLIFTGVAGTGKTHRLLEIQKLYDASIDTSWSSWRVQQISHYAWCDVVCAVLLFEDRMMTVPEMVQHQIVKDKMLANQRSENINQTLWVQLNKHAHPESLTVHSSQRSANYYFDKTESSHWFLLPDVKSTLSQRLSDLLSCYDDNAQQQYAQRHTFRRSCLLSFHQSYGYDEFVEGIRPQINPQTGQMQYDIRQGAFLELCGKAMNDPEHRYALLIDEINRANTAQVFGELMSVIEPSKRAGSTTPMSVRLAYSGRLFTVPSNVDIYATMNTQDHSLAPLDMAFRRRFDFVVCNPDSTLLHSINDDEGETVDLAKMMQILNQRLVALLGIEAQLGQSYFMHITDIAELAQRLYRQIIPQIMEYIKLTTMPAQTMALLIQVLYGCSIDQALANIENCLYQSVADAEVVSRAEIESLQGLATQVVLAPDFVAVANSNDRMLNKVQASTNKQNSIQLRFLSAKPYQKLYEPLL